MLCVAREKDTEKIFKFSRVSHYDSCFGFECKSLKEEVAITKHDFPGFNKNVHRTFYKVLQELSLLM